jgi:hypothetical protein
MGLTINFGIESNTNSPKVARQLLEKIRQIALDTPFEHVGEVGEYFNVDDPRDWHLIQSSEYIRYPWNNHISTAVYPEHLYVFSIAVFLMILMFLWVTHELVEKHGRYYLPNF